MTSGKDVQSIMLKVEELSKGHIYFREDLEKLVVYSIENEKLSLLEELSFHAKFTSGLLRIVQKKDSTIDDNYFLKATDEYQKGIFNVKNILQNLIEGTSEFIKLIFTEKYLQLTQQCLSNLNYLCSDLSFLKLYFNDLKTNAGNK